MNTFILMVVLSTGTIVLALPNIKENENWREPGVRTSIIKGPDGSNIISSIRPGSIEGNVIRGPSAISTIVGPKNPTTDHHKGEKPCEHTGEKDKPKENCHHQHPPQKPNKPPTIPRPRPVPVKPIHNKPVPIVLPPHPVKEDKNCPHHIQNFGHSWQKPQGHGHYKPIGIGHPVNPINVPSSVQKPQQCAESNQQVQLLKALVTYLLELIILSSLESNYHQLWNRPGGKPVVGITKPPHGHKHDEEYITKMVNDASKEVLDNLMTMNSENEEQDEKAKGVLEPNLTPPTQEQHQWFDNRQESESNADLLESKFPQPDYQNYQLQMSGKNDGQFFHTQDF